MGLGLRRFHPTADFKLVEAGWRPFPRPHFQIQNRKKRPSVGRLGRLFLAWWRRGRPRLQLTPTTKMAARCRSYTWRGTRGRPSSAYLNIFASAAWRSRLYHAPSSDQQGYPKRADCSTELTSMIRKSRRDDLGLRTFLRSCAPAAGLIGTDLLMAWAYLVETGDRLHDPFNLEAVLWGS